MRYFNFEGISKLFQARANTELPQDTKDFIETKYEEFLSLEHVTRNTISLPIYMDLATHGDFYDHGRRYQGLPG
jgi:hypothetical protein